MGTSFFGIDRHRYRLVQVGNPTIRGTDTDRMQGKVVRHTWGIIPGVPPVPEIGQQDRAVQQVRTGLSIGQGDILHRHHFTGLRFCPSDRIQPKSSLGSNHQGQTNRNDSVERNKGFVVCRMFKEVWQWIESVGVVLEKWLGQYYCAVEADLSDKNNWLRISWSTNFSIKLGLI